MFDGFSRSTIDFMWNIRLNNNKIWFEAHKDEFKQNFYNPMKELGQEIFEVISEGFPAYGFIHKLSRIYKDARRVKDGNPYRDCLWFSIEKPGEEWTSTPVFWFELKPECWSYGLGFYSAKPMTMAKLRARINNNPKEFEELIASLEKQEEFKLDGPEYARKKEAPTLKTAEWYNKKTFSLIHQHQNGEELFSRKLISRLIEGYKFLMPFYDYLNMIDLDSPPAY